MQYLSQVSGKVSLGYSAFIEKYQNAKHWFLVRSGQIHIAEISFCFFVNVAVWSVCFMDHTSRSGSTLRISNPGLST